MFDSIRVAALCACALSVAIGCGGIAGSLTAAGEIDAPEIGVDPSRHRAVNRDRTISILIVEEANDTRACPGGDIFESSGVRLVALNGVWLIEQTTADAIGSMLNPGCVYQAHLAGSESSVSGTFHLTEAGLLLIGRASE